MAFKATALSTSQAFTNLRQQAAQTKQYLTAQRAAMVSATCDAQVPLHVIQHLGQADVQMTEWAAVPGLADYARAQVNNPAYDVVAEFSAMKTAITAAKSALATMFPKDGAGYVLYQTILATGALQNRTFTAAQLASAVAQIDAVIASID